MVRHIQSGDQRLDNVLITIYGTQQAEIADFELGKIDIMDWPIDLETYNLIKNDPAYVCPPLTMYDVYDIDINNLVWPTSDTNFRRALVYLVDYEDFYTTVLGAYSGTLMDNIIFSEWTKWYNPSTQKYYFNTTMADQILNEAGYIRATPGGVRHYHNSTGDYPLPALEFYAREDDPFRKSLGDMINEQ